MVKWTYCEKEIPTYLDMIEICRNINYKKRRMWSIKDSPYEQGYDDFTAQEAINNYIKEIKHLSEEYSFMIRMYWKESGRLAI